MSVQTEMQVRRWPKRCYRGVGKLCVRRKSRWKMRVVRPVKKSGAEAFGEVVVIAGQLFEFEAA
jgi:hypothetical protein